MTRTAIPGKAMWQYRRIVLAALAIFAAVALSQEPALAGAAVPAGTVAAAPVVAGIPVAEGTVAGAAEVAAAVVPAVGEVPVVGEGVEGAEGAEGAEGEEGEEEPAASESDFCVALMLLAGVTFVMSTFYLVNHHDKDIQKAAWEIISDTLSIFSSVLLFSSVNGCVKYYILGMKTEEDEASWALKIGVGLAHTFFWYFLLQFSLSIISGAVDVPQCCARADGYTMSQRTVIRAQLSDDDEEEMSERNDKEDAKVFKIGKSVLVRDDGETTWQKGEVNSMKPLRVLVGEGPDREWAEVKVDTFVEAMLDLKCWSVLLGHMTGFAAINAFGTLQMFMLEDFETDPCTLENVMKVLSTPLVAFVAMWILFCIFQFVRDSVALGDDGQVDEWEELWIEMTIETENDALALVVSFLTVQVVRFCICGAMANEEGLVEREMKYTVKQGLVLISIGLAIFFLHVLRTKFLKDVFSKRAEIQFRMTCGMCFAWCYFFGLKYLVDFLISSNQGYRTIAAVGLSVCITFFSYVMIFILDKIADLPDEWTDAECDRSIREFIKALGILIGFAWEKSFDAAVVSVAARISSFPPPITEIILALFICLCVIPALRYHILDQMNRLGVFKEDEEEEKEEEFEEIEEFTKTFVRRK